VASLARTIGRYVQRIVGSAAGVAGGFTTSAWKTGPRMDAQSMLKSYETMPWLRTFTQKISHDFATLTWTVSALVGPDGRAFKDISLQRCRDYKTRSGMLRRYAKQQQLRDIPNHPLLDMLTAGNEFFPGLVSMQLSQQYLDLIGELAWILNPNKYGMPVEFLPIPPTWITRLPERTRDTADAGTYTVSGPGATYEVPADRMLFAYHPRPANPFTRGTGLSQVLGDELETDEYAAKYTKDWFLNRAIPPVLISGVGVGLPELQRLEERWLGKFMRVGAGWLPQFLGTKVDVHQLSQTFEQQQLGPLRKNERDTIRMVYGLPPEKIGDVSASNRSTIEASDFIYQSGVIVPRAEFMRAMLQALLVPLYDDRLVLDYVSPVQEDREFMLKVRQAQPHAWDVDEWREFGGSDALPSGRGKVHFMPFNLTPVRLGSGERPAAPQLPAAPGGQDEDEPIDAEPVPVDVEAEEVEAGMGARRRLLAESRALSAAQILRIANAANVAVLTSRGRRVVQSVVEQFGGDTVDDLGVGISFDMADPAVEEFLRRWGAERMTLVNDTTRLAVRTTLAEGAAAGEPIAKLKQRIQHVFAVASDARAANIASTEINRASSFGAFEAMRQAGLESKAWLATQDGDVRDTHVAMDGQEQPLMEMFVSPSGGKGMYPGDFGMPEEDCRCRCAVVTVLAKKGATRQAQWKALDSERLPFITLMRTEMRTAFGVQETAVLRALAGGKGSEDSWTRTA
jgi:hypothetical protein